MPPPPHEYDDVRRLGLRAPVTIIPNGVDVPDEVVWDEASGRQMLLFLGRIHPTKQVDVLLRIWRKVQGRFREWDLCIAGGDGGGGYLDEMRRRAGRLGCERVTFPGEVFGAAKEELLRKGHLFILPSHSENFGVAVAEALAHGLPSIVTKGAPWGGLEREGCGWWVDNRQDSLIESLEFALSLPSSSLRDMGFKGHEWIKRDFSWEHIAGMMEQTYQWLLGRGAKPDWVVEE